MRPPHTQHPGSSPADRWRHAVPVQLPLGPHARDQHGAWTARTALRRGGAQRPRTYARLSFLVVGRSNVAAAHNYHVALQCQLPVPRGIPTASDDERARRMARQARHQAGTHRRSVVLTRRPASDPNIIKHIQRRRNTRTSRSSSTAARTSNRRAKIAF